MNWRLLTLALPLGAGVCAAVWTDLAFWVGMKEGLIAFLGFLAAALVQVMPITANFLQSDRLLPAEAQRLNRSLTKQQEYWMGLLSLTVFSLVIVIVIAAAADRANSFPILFRHAWFIDLTWTQLLTFFMVACVTLVLQKMVGLFNGIMSLHHLRAELVLANAQRAADEKISSQQIAIPQIGDLVPDSYGKIVTH